MTENFGNNIGNVWRRLSLRFEKAGINSANLDAKLLVAHGLSIDQLQLVVEEKRLVRPDQIESIEQLALRRLTNEPVARILGFKEFYSLEFLLNAATLIPRPETEMLVELGIKLLTGKRAPKILELGVGSGCVIISLLNSIKQAQAIGVDISGHALEAAGNNGQVHGVENRINWLCGSWFEPIKAQEKFDLIVANPPYIAKETIAILSADVREFDPEIALDGGVSGLDAYEQIIGKAKNFLCESGVLLLEIGFDQAQSVSRLCQSGGFAQVKMHHDLGGLDRVIEAK